VYLRQNKAVHKESQNIGFRQLSMMSN